MLMMEKISKAKYEYTDIPMGENQYANIDFENTLFVDAKYTLTVPISVSMETGFDVLAHAIESYVSRKANLFSEMLSENAIKIVSEYLPIIKNKPDDILAREKLCYASNGAQSCKCWNVFTT